MTSFVEVKNDSQLQLFATYKVKLMNEIKSAASNLGFLDKDIQEYTIDRALKSFKTRDNFLISYNGIYVGGFQVLIRESLFETKEIAYLHNIYVEEKFRNLGIGNNIIRYIHVSYKKPIECECWYGMSSLYFFNSLGFKWVRITLYSDQNCISENKK